MTVVMKLIDTTKPSLISKLPAAERERIERNAEAARERLKRGAPHGSNARVNPA